MKLQLLEPLVPAIGSTDLRAFGALVVLFTMLIVTRERTREIGVLKAIGASNFNVAALYTGETFTLAVLGGGLGVVIFLLGGPVIKRLSFYPQISKIVSPKVLRGNLLGCGLYILGGGGSC